MMHVLRSRHIGLAIGSGAAIASCAAAYAALTDEGLQRSMTFWARAMPVYAHYRATQYWVKNEPDAIQDAAFQALHDRYASKMEDLVLDLRGFYLKLAQVGSTRDEFLPSQYMIWAKRMQGEVPTETPFAVIRNIIETDLGAGLESIFSEFDELPIGSASIGQVHRARLMNGKRVAVKVMYPNIEQKFRVDLQTAKRFCSMAQPAHLPFMNEIEKQFLTEFDYQLEAENLALIRANILPIWGKKVAIPEPYLDLCSKRVLVMEYLQGVKLVDGIMAQYERIAKRMGTTLKVLQDEQKRQMAMGQVKSHSLTYEETKVSMINGVLYVLDMIRNSWRVVVNYSVAKVGLVHPLDYKFFDYQINLGTVLKLLLQVHAHQIFIDGSFNADCHPGNILLMKDGRLGLIDYGQVKHISQDVRTLYAHLIKALANDDRQEIVRIVRESGLRTAKMDPDVIYRLACFWHDRDTDDITDGLNIQMFVEELERRDPVVAQNDEYVMLGRVSILLRGMGNAFHLNLRVSKYWLPYAEQIIAQQAKRIAKSPIPSSNIA